MKVKDCKGNLEGIKVKTPKGIVGHWKSQWYKGVWLNQSPGETRMYPQFVDDLKDCLEWEVTEEEVNCHLKLSLNEIDNKLC